MGVSGRLFVTGLAALSVAACGNLRGANLVFGQQHTVGLSIGGSTTDRGAELTLGYKDRDIAVVPVAVDQPSDGMLIPITSTNPGPNPGDRTFADSQSVIGQFSLNGGANPGPQFGLGKFFATGLAAQKLAEGFADRMRGSQTNTVERAAAPRTTGD
jgi:hypothetical protein